MTTSPGAPTAEPSGTVPRWFARILVVLFAVVAGYGATGLVLALAGLCTPVAVGVLGTAVALGLGRMGWQLDPAPAHRRSSAWAAGALILAFASIAFNGPNAGQHVVVNRDPGVYLVAGRWIAAQGTLEVDAGKGPFSADGVVLESSGTYDRGNGVLDLQFNHLVPVLLAEAHWLGGNGLMTIVPVLLGASALLATYALATRLTGRDWAGFLVAATLAACLPVVAAVRDTYSEPAAWMLLAGGLWLWTVAADEAQVRIGALAGLVLGAVAMARIDGIVYLLPVPLAAWLVASRLRRTAVAFALGLAPGVGISAADLLLRSRQYFLDLAPGIVSLWTALAVFALVGWVAAVRADRNASGRSREPGAWIARHKRVLATGAASAVVVVGLYGWFIRPHAQVARSSRPFEYIGPIQAAEGQPVDPARRYDERSMGWIAWYLGSPAVALAIMGGALVVHRSVKRRTPAIVCWLALSGGTVFYLWRPSITPDQIWATRRFVPAVLPLFLMLAAVAVVAVAAWLGSRRGHVTALAAGAALSLAVGALALARTVPVAALSDQHGYLALVDELCAEVGGGAVLAVEGERAGIVLTQTVRSFCGVPAGLLDSDGASPQRVAELGAGWAAEGRTLYVLAASPDVVGALVPGAGVTEVGPYRSDQMLEVTVTRPPRQLAVVGETFYVAEVPR